MSRREAVLRILDKQSEPIRGRALYDLLLEEPEGWKWNIQPGSGERAEAFWYADFSGFMTTLVEAGLVYRWKPRYESKAFFYITQRGRSLVRPKDMQKVLRRQMRYYVRHWMRNQVTILRNEGEELDPWYTERAERYQSVLDAIKERIDKGEEYFKKRCVLEYMSVFVRYHGDPYESDKEGVYKRVVLQQMTEDEFKQIFTREVKQRLYRTYRTIIRHLALDEHHEPGIPSSWVLDRKERLEGLMKMWDVPIPENQEQMFKEALQQIRKSREHDVLEKKICALCFRGVHNKRAVEDAELLEKYTGFKTGVVCCWCFEQLKQREKEVEQTATTSSHP